MELIGLNLRLRPLMIQDLPKLIIWNQDPEVQFFVDCDFPVELGKFELWYRSNLPDRHYQIFAIETIDGCLIGDLELDHICWSRREAELRIRIGEKAFWGKGFGTEALELILKYVMEEKNFNRIYLRVYTFNYRAIRCYLKNGFKQIGILQRKHNTWKEIVLMEITRTRYAKLQKNNFNHSQLVG